MNFHYISSSDSDSLKNENDSDSDLLLEDLLRKNDYSPVQNKTNKRKKKTDEEKEKFKKEKLDRRKKREEIKEEKMRIQKEKTKEKEEKKKASQLLKRIQPGECLKYIHVVLDSELLNQKFAGEVLTAIQAADLQYTIKNQNIPNTITWIRRTDEGEKEEDHMIMVLMAVKLIHLVASKTLTSSFKNYVDKNTTLVIYGIEEYFKYNKKSKNRKLKNNVQGNEKLESRNEFDNVPWVSRAEIEISLAELQILCNMQNRCVENNQELALFVIQFTKSVAELPYKQERNKKNESTDWYATADSKECVRVDNDGNGLLRLWQQQICQFTNVGLDIAQAIVSVYNSPQSLIQSWNFILWSSIKNFLNEAYDKCVQRKEAELLLQNIPVRRCHGPLTTVRKVGPELSKKLYILLNNVEGDASLGQDS